MARMDELPSRPFGYRSPFHYMHPLIGDANLRLLAVGHPTSGQKAQEEHEPHGAAERQCLPPAPCQGSRGRD